jgi:DNA polymerase-1
MHERGIRVDLEGMKMAREAITRQLEDLSCDLFKIMGKELNVDSPKQLIDYFYGELELTPYKNRKTGKVTTDANALKRLARKGIEEAKILQDIRKLGKLLSTYLGGSKEGSSVEAILSKSDGRLRCVFDPARTETGRLASKKDLDNSGMNLQNQPQEIRRYFLFDEGYIGYNIDLSQAENRIVAYVGPVPEMIECFERGLDVHSLTGSMISGLPPDVVKQQDKTDVYAPIGSGNYSWRFWGKKCNHGLNYDEGYRTFSFILEIPEKDGKLLVDTYHRSYPGVRQGFHEQVQNMLRTSRTVTNLLGRKRLFLDRWGDNLFKEAYAQIPQSSVADIINEYGLSYIYRNDFFKYVELLLQVHDSIIFQIPKFLPWEVHARLLLAIKKSLEPKLEWRSRRFVIPADVQMSTTHMAKIDNGLHDIKKDAFENEETLARELEEMYNKLIKTTRPFTH